jgi:hypothetical protein
MDTVVLIGMLNEIERGLGKLGINSLRMLVLQAQDCALRIQRDTGEQHLRDSRHAHWQN